MSPSSENPAAPMDARGLAWSGLALLAALALPSAIASVLDERTLFGVSVWAKPLKFDGSLALHLLTIFVLLGCLPRVMLERPRVRRVVLAGVLCAVLEALYITLQAARGRPSHYSLESPLETFLYYGVMGPAALVIVGSAFAVGWWLWRDGEPQRPAGLRWGGAVGLMLGSVATLGVTSVLSSGAVDGLGHWVGGARTDESGLPVFGWSTTGGDLRVPHFFATHLMQALPIVGWLADQADPRRARAWVLLAALAGVVLVVSTLWQAIEGRPFLSPASLGR